MSGPAHANGLRDLIVYRKARDAARNIFLLSKSFPREEMFSLTDQIRRSSRSVGAQIAEAWAKRRYEKHFLSKLTDADREQQETQHWIEVASDCGYISGPEGDELLEQYAEIGRLPGGMIAKAHLFCNPDALSIRDEVALYITED